MGDSDESVSRHMMADALRDADKLGLSSAVPGAPPPQKRRRNRREHKPKMNQPNVVPQQAPDNTPQQQQAPNGGHPQYQPVFVMPPQQPQQQAQQQQAPAKEEDKSLLIRVVEIVAPVVAGAVATRVLNGSNKSTDFSREKKIGFYGLLTVASAGVLGLVGAHVYTSVKGDPLLRG